MDSSSQTLPSFSHFVSRVYYHGLIHGVRMLAVQKGEFQPCLDSCNPSTCLPAGNASAGYGLLSRNSSTHTHAHRHRGLSLSAWVIE